MDIGVLGPVELRPGSGAPVPVMGARLRTLLILLALDAGRAVPTARLVDGVWGDEPPSGVGGALQALVSRLRRTAPELTVAAVPTGYRLDLDRDRVDAHRFTRLVAEGRARQDAAALRDALGLWRGPAEFPEAARPEQVRLERLRLDAMYDRIAIEFRLDHADVVPELESLTAAHPLHEPFAELLMRALIAAGNPGGALQVYERIRGQLADSFGTDPSPELAALHLETLRGRPAKARGNLPSPVSSFVGRELDIARVQELLREHRLVTLTGPGGAGKTRLSVEAAAGMAQPTSWPQHPRADIGRRTDGPHHPKADVGQAAAEAWRVELAPVTDPAEVPQAVLTALGLRSQVLIRSGVEHLQPLDRLREALSGRSMVLMLDNCEHLIDAAATVADELLKVAPGLRVLATSREPLGIPGEQVFVVEPLALPPTEGHADGAAAVRLLVDRAGPSFQLDGTTVGPAVRICRALDGMPLAIELAAARLRSLPVDLLAERLTDRFRLLTTGSRTALPRHQTLRAVVDWSWDLLDERERAAWRRFSIFPGGADLTVAEQVCGTDVTVLGALADKSLLVRDGDRLRMLETIREYGRERLTEAGESERVRLAHAASMVDLAKRAEPELRGVDQLHWLRVLAREHDNFHAAVRMAIEAGDAPTAVALAGHLGWYWWLRGHRTEGHLLTRDVVGMDLTGAAAEDLALAYTFLALNGLEGASGMDDVKTWFFEAEKTGAAAASRHPVLRLLRPLTAIYEAGGQATGLDELTPLRADPDPWLRAISTMISAQMRLNFGLSTDTAHAEMREALDLFRITGDRWGIGFSLSFLGEFAAAQGDFAEAVTWQRDALALVREVGIREDLPQMMVKLAHRLWMADDPESARCTLDDARRTAEEIGETGLLVSVEFGWAMLAREEGHLDEARKKLALAAELREGPVFAPQFDAMLASTTALVDGAEGNLDAARDHHVEALRIAVDTWDAPVVAQVIAAIGDYALRRGDPAEAARLLGAADAVRGSEDRSVPDVDRITAEAKAALGEEEFARAYARGSEVTLQTAGDAIRLQDEAP